MWLLFILLSLSLSSTKGWWKHFHSSALAHWPVGATTLQQLPTLKFCDSLTYPFFHCALLSFLNFLTYFLVDRVGVKGRLARPRWVLWHEDDSGLKAMEKFFPSLHYIEVSKLWVFSRIRVISRDEFYLNDPSVKQGKHLITRHVLFLMPHEVQSFPLKSQPWLPSP